MCFLFVFGIFVRELGDLMIPSAFLRLPRPQKRMNPRKPWSGFPGLRSHRGAFEFLFWGGTLGLFLSFSIKLFCHFFGEFGCIWCFVMFCNGV